MLWMLALSGCFLAGLAVGASLLAVLLIRELFPDSKPDSRLSPPATSGDLMPAMPPITAEILRAVAPPLSGAKAKSQAQIIAAIAGEFDAVLNEYDINTPLRVAHFLAQIIHETAGLQTTEEFASGKRYEGRADLGNTLKGDGVRYKGRGLLQLTGRANYRRIGKLLGIDLENEPHIAAEPLVSLRIACVYWQDHKINPHCDADDLLRVTKIVNGGTNGLEDRRVNLLKAKHVLALSEEARVASAELAAATAEPHELVSRTIDGATLVQRAGAALGATGVAKGVVDATATTPAVAPPPTPVLPSLEQAADGIGIAQKLMNGLGEVAKFAMAHYWIAVIVVGALLWWYGRKIVAAYIDDIRTGKRQPVFKITKTLIGS